ncbi:MmcQ/YjbR family DNA-binding protein [Peptoanaerobacter stomatis]|nr:MmcQ/YjbR family DNA-binding protein [Peptoanaerobacter stomatis]
MYPGYHMNHKHWISVVLNETLSDNEVMKLIENSFSLT